MKGINVKITNHKIDIFKIGYFKEGEKIEKLIGGNLLISMKKITSIALLIHVLIIDNCFITV